MTRKRLLFVIPCLGGGGAEKSLINLLRALERRGAGAAFDVDVYLFRRQGLFLDQLPPWVRVLCPGEPFERFDGPAGTGIRWFLRRGRWDLAFCRICYGFAQKRTDPLAAWRWLRYALPRPKERYDAAAGYLEGCATYFAAERVRAGRRLGFFHNEYSSHAAMARADKRYFPRLDAVVGVSALCCDSLRTAYPQLREKIAKVENIVSPALLRSLAGAQPPPWEADGNPVLLTIGRAAAQKGLDLAVRACGILRREGVRLRWFQLGSDGEQLCALIREEGAEEMFFPLGETDNPYPALAACDIYVQPSRYEGKSLAIEEAKALAKPIVCTRFGTVADQLTDGEIARLAEISPEGIAAAIRELLENAALRERFRARLAARASGNEDQADAFLQLAGCGEFCKLEEDFSR
ncbi:MAG: glycosyltransferase [Oscillospiraceae bacterium]|nr:glycosyltransferase [Oscillospiraceae bacterium]